MTELTACQLSLFKDQKVPVIVPLICLLKTRRLIFISTAKYDLNYLLNSPVSPTAHAK